MMRRMYELARAAKFKLQMQDLQTLFASEKRQKRRTQRNMRVLKNGHLRAAGCRKACKLYEEAENVDV